MVEKFCTSTTAAAGRGETVSAAVKQAANAPSERRKYGDRAIASFIVG